MLNNSIELWKGLSDLPQGVISVILSFIIFKTKSENKKEKTNWFLLFLLTGIASFAGCAVHSFDLGAAVQKTVWTFLYFILYTAVILFSFCIVGFTTGKAHPTNKEKNGVVIAAFIFLFFSVLTLLIGVDLDIFIFVGYCVLLIIPVAYYSVKAGKKASSIFTATIVLAAALVFQALRPIFPLGVAVAHLLIAVSLFFVYLTAKADLKG